MRDSAQQVRGAVIMLRWRVLSVCLVGGGGGVAQQLKGAGTIKYDDVYYLGFFFVCFCFFYGEGLKDKFSETIPQNIIQAYGPGCLKVVSECHYDQSMLDSLVLSTLNSCHGNIGSVEMTLF